MSNVNKINEYIKLLDLEKEFKIELFNSVSDYLKNLNESFIVLNKPQIAKLFCLNIGKLNPNLEVESEVAEKIISSFENISKMESEQDEDVYIRTIAFLNKLFSQNENEYIDIQINTDTLEEEFKILLENLERIRSIFSLKKEGKTQFPISKLLYNIIQGRDFIGDTISSESFRTLILALEIFKYDEEGYSEETESVKRLITTYNLKCIDYIMNDNAFKIGGEDIWKDNFEKNGILILYNDRKHKVLIRSTHEDYFNNPVWNPTENLNIEYEVNNNNKKIAWFYEYTIDEKYEIKTCKELFEKEIELDEIKNIFKLIFDESCHNIFYEQAILVHNTEMLPINPFSRNDKIICLNKLTKSSGKESVIELLKKYSLQVIGGIGIDCATVGLILELLSIKLISIDELFFNITKRTNNIQNTIIKNWIDRNGDFIEFYKKFNDELNYLKKLSDFENEVWRMRSFYPIKIDENIIRIINFESKYSGYTYKSIKIEEDYTSKKVFEINEEEIAIEKIEYFNEEKDYLEYKNEFNALYNEQEKKIIVGTDIDNNKKLIDKIYRNNRYLVDSKWLDTISEIQVKEILKLVKLHQKALIESFFRNVTTGHITFLSLFKYKLINNLLCYKIIPEKLNEYIKLLHSHHLMDFSDVKQDSVISNIKNNTLVVPKDRSSTQSVLKDIYYEYIKDKDHRSEIDFFDNNISKDASGKYCRNKVIIDKILFIFDNIENGTSTLGALGEYLNYNGENIVSIQGEDKNVHLGRKRQRFYCDGKEITLKEIISKNTPQIELHAFFMSKEGKQKIEEFIRDNNLNIKVTFFKEFDNLASKEMIDLGTKLFGKCKIRDNNYLIIREFNQPKKNIFPDSMLDSNNIVSLFVVKPEL